MKGIHYILQEDPTIVIFYWNVRCNIIIGVAVVLTILRYLYK